jgi:ferredoxin-NADP reductase
VYVTGRHLDRFPARAGQFCIWRFPGHHHWWTANPFSLSAAPGGQGLRLTAKAVGGTSAGLRTLPPGSRAFVEGPYGAFTSLHRSRTGTLLIAGGVGITPVRAMLEEQATGDVVVLYRVRSEADAVLLNEVRHLVAQQGGRLHLLTGRTGEQGVPPFGPAALQQLVPDITDRDVYVCGPPPHDHGRALRAAGPAGPRTPGARGAVRPGLTREVSGRFRSCPVTSASAAPPAAVRRCVRRRPPP